MTSRRARSTPTVNLDSNARAPSTSGCDANVKTKPRPSSDRSPSRFTNPRRLSTAIAKQAGLLALLSTRGIRQPRPEVTASKIYRHFFPQARFRLRRRAYRHISRRDERVPHELGVAHGGARAGHQVPHQKTPGWHACLGPPRRYALVDARAANFVRDPRERETNNVPLADLFPPSTSPSANVHP